MIIITVKFTIIKLLSVISASPILNMYCNMTYPVNLLTLTSEFSIIVIMEEAKTKFYESIDILEERNVEIL